MPRLEYKYYFPYTMLDSLREAIKPFLDYDAFCGAIQKKEYTVRSIYLDDDNYFTYNEKLDGVKERLKFRIRGYNQQDETSKVFLEIKRRNMDFISKDRALMNFTNLPGFLQTADYSLLSANAATQASFTNGARNFMYYYHLYHLKPRVIITYEREAYECKYGTGLRVTFDKNIRACPTAVFSNLYSEQNMVTPIRDYFVLEVKFYKMLPGWLPDVLQRYNIFRGSASKYVLGIDNTMFNFSNH